MESPPSLENSEISSPSVRPIIEYDPSLKKPDVPYTISVNAETCANLFRELGISDEKISKLRIKVSKEGIMSKLTGKRVVNLGMYNALNNSVVIYGDFFWKQYGKYMQVLGEAEDLRGGQVLEGVLRVEDLGAKESPEKGEKNVNEKLIGVFLHESKHLADNKNLKRKALRLAVGLGTFGGIGALGFAVQNTVPIEPLNSILGYSLSALSAPLYYITDPYEIRANSFERKNKGNPRWRNLITISPKGVK